MDQEKRIMFAFALSFVVLVLGRVFFLKTVPPPPPKAPVSTSAPVQSQSSAPSSPVVPVGKNAGSSKPVKSSKAGAQGKPEVIPALPIQQGSKAEEIVVENDVYRITLSSQGALVKTWILKKYTDQKGQLLDVIDDLPCEQLGYPMSLQFPTGDPALATELNQAIYVSDASSPSGESTPKDLTASVLRAPIKLTFVYSDGKVESRKQFTFGRGYEVQVEASVRDGKHDLPVAVSWPGGFGDHSLPPAQAAAATLAFYQTTDSAKIHEAYVAPPSFIRRLIGSNQSTADIDVNVDGSLASGGLEDRFFAAAFLPASPQVDLHVTRQVWTPPDFKGDAKAKPKTLEAILTTQEPKPLTFRLFVAPKDLDVLRSVTPSLEGLVDFGFFTFFAKPLFLALRYIYERWVHNYGWAIIILTFLINFAMFPLKVKSIRSAQHMQKIAPLVKDVQERYKQYKFNDPRKQRMNQEVMELYKKHGVNPLGGCLPMALQLPFLYGFYRVLYLSIELRHAPWILWITDLSAPDNFHLLGFPLPILPTLNVVAMFVLQKMTPMATTDPGQQRMMVLMPLIFGLMFYNFASGLVLYYLAASIMGIAQQIFINRTMPMEKLVPVARKAAEE